MRVWHRFGLWLMATCFVLPSCGYSSRRLTDFPTARTVAVLPFENTGYRRDLELRLTQAVLAEVRTRTDLGLASPTQADLILSGAGDVRQQLLVQGGDLQADQYRLFGSVVVSVTDRRTGAVLRQRTVSDREEVRVETPTETIEGSGIDEWARRMAVRVVQVLERDL